MKKLFTILTVALALVAVASCSNQEEYGNPAGEMVKVTYSLEGPAGVATKATKAMGKVTSNYQLYYEVRLWDGVNLGNPLTGDKLSGNQTVTATQWPVNIEFNLARNKQYKILFWAQSVNPPAGLYTIDAEKGLTKVTIDYSNMEANNEDCDVFCGYDVITPAGSSAVSLTLSRPLALLSLGTSDAAEYRTASGNCEVGKVSATVTGTMGTGINVATGDITTGSVTIGVEKEPIDAYNAKTLAVGASSYNYLNAVYFIPGADLVSVSYTISDNQATPAAITAAPLQVTNVPVAANYRTNIVGKLLTGTIEYNITLDEFDGVKNKIDNPSFASIAALNAYFETLASNADNGNINPETVTLTAVEAEEPKTIVLPAVTENIKILMPVTAPDLDLTMKYATGATAEQKPANIYFYVTNIKTLTADITSTHFELLEGSWINTAAYMSTSGSSFVVRKGAKVGTVVVNQGSASIAGEVKTVSVPSGATADGEDPGADNAVQVFLAKDAAVEQINLAAKSDVVVEQPANNIDVVATEKKVCVNIASTATGSTALAQNGGQIYVNVAGGVNCNVAADGTSGESEGSVPSSITIATAGDGAVIEANETNGGEVVSSTEAEEAVKFYVAQIVGGEKYESLFAAVGYAESGATITLIADDRVSLTSGGEIEINKSLTITGATATNGEPLYTIYGKSTVTGTNDIFITGNGEVTLSNMKVKNFGNDANTNAGHSPIFVSSYFTGKVNLTNVYVSDFNRGGIFLYGGEFNVKDCYIDCANSRSGAFTKGIEIKGSAHGTISDTFICNMERSGSDSPAGIEIYGNGSIVVDGCNIVSDDGNHQSVKATYGIVSSRVGVHNPSGGSATIKDCSFDCTNACLSVSDSDEYGPVNNYSFIVDKCDFNNYIATWSATSSITINRGSYAEDVYAYAGTITIHGGEFANFAPYAGSSGSIVIDGGLFDTDPSDYVADGYKVEASGDSTYPYTVVESDEIVWSYNAFVAALYQNNGTFDGNASTINPTGKTFIVKWSPESGDFTNGTATYSTPLRVNNSVPQFHIGDYQPNSWGIMDMNIAISNVTFKLIPADFTVVGGTHGSSGSFPVSSMKGYELFLHNNGNIIIKNCVFDGVMLATFNGENDQTHQAESVTIVNGCTFKNSKYYGMHETRAAYVYVTNNTFENLGCAIMLQHESTKAPKQAAIVAGNTFVNVDVEGYSNKSTGEYGLMQVAAGVGSSTVVWSKNSATNCSGKDLRQLSSATILTKKNEAVTFTLSSVSTNYSANISSITVNPDGTASYVVE